MALQGNQRDIQVTEILQLLGSQKKTGKLMLENGSTKLSVYVADGRIVSTREPGLPKDDRLLAFLRLTRRLTEEQILGLTALHQESRRDLEDLLVNGGYMEAEDLAGSIERQILDDLMMVMRWPQGAYSFDPNARWSSAPLVKLNMEGIVMEIARRADETKRYAGIFRDPHMLIAVKDLPDGDELSEDERELFAMVDGMRTVSEIVAAAPMTEFETYDALNRMLESNWVEMTTRRIGAPPPEPLVAAPAHAPAKRRFGFLREVAMMIMIAAGLLGMRAGTRLLEPYAAHRITTDDVFAAAQLRDLRIALDLYRRERSAYPPRLDELVKDAWIAPGQARMRGYVLYYRPLHGGDDYQLELQPEQ
jgi:hypothetical protein